MSKEYYNLNFGKYFKAVRRFKWIVILCLAGSISLGVIMGKRRVLLYQARMALWAREPKAEREVLSEKFMQLFFIGQAEHFEVNYGTQIALIKSSLILQKVVERLGLPSEGPKELSDSIKTVRNSISVSKMPNTTIIEIKAVHRSPEVAVNMANAVYEQYNEFNKNLYVEEEQRKLKSMEEQVRVVREEMGKSNDLITEKLKADMYLLLMGKIAESRLNLSLGQLERLKVIDKAEVTGPVPRRSGVILFGMGLLGLFFGIALAITIDTFRPKGG